MEEQIKVKIEPNFAGDYRIEYDSKYVTLFGRDKNFIQFKFNETEPDTFEEMVLVACIIEIRDAKPRIVKVDDEFIYIDLRVGEQYEW